MRQIRRVRLARFLALGGVLCGAGLLAGCQGDAQFSKKEMEQFKQGPPKEMPAEAKKAFEDAMKANKGGPPAGVPGGGGPPPSAGQ